MTFSATVRPQLLPMDCGFCGQQLRVDTSVEVKTAKTYESCALRCERCQVGYSNSRDPRKRVPIFARPELNVPEKLRNDLDDTLGMQQRDQHRDRERQRP